jgi:hypothetical protein
MSIKLHPAGPQGTEAKTTHIRSYQHASRIFVDGNFRLSPKYGFLFYVEFDFNPLISNVSNTAAQEMGMIVKNVGLPKFSIDTKVHNAYNRVNLVQNKIKYDPINITFHDDQADVIRNFWYDYYSFFYRDSDYNDASYQIISKYQERPSFSWGYTPRPVQSYNAANAYQSYQYIQAIRIYSLYQKNFAEYELVNPIITSFKHGDHSNSDTGGLLEHQMSVQFETVKYQTGYTTENTVGGYIDLHYDSTPTPLVTNPGDVNLVDNGMGGASPANDTIVDLANNNLNSRGGSVMPGISPSVLNASASFAGIASSVASYSAGAGVNAGGFALPALGSLTSGLTSGMLGNQLRQAALGIAGSAATSLAGGLIKGAAEGLGLTGAQGSAIAGLIAGGITNPQATLNTVVNMAGGALINKAMQYEQQAISAITDQVKSAAAGATGAISTAIGDAASAVSDTVGGAVNDAKAYYNSVTNTSSNPGGPDDYST